MATEKALCCKLDKGTTIYLFHADKQQVCKAKVIGYSVEKYNRFDDVYLRVLAKQQVDKKIWATVNIYFRPEDAILGENKIKASHKVMDRDGWLSFIKSLAPKKEKFLQHAYFEDGYLKIKYWYIRDNRIEHDYRYVSFKTFCNETDSENHFTYQINLDTDLKVKEFGVALPLNLAGKEIFPTEADAKKTLLKRIKVC